MTDRDQSENQRRERLRARWRAEKRRYRATPKGKAVHLESQSKYQRTAKGKAVARRKHLMKKYGITEGQYMDMFLLQGGKCICCGRPPKKNRLAVEHDHSTGRVRGLACFNCNKHIIGRNTKKSARWLVVYLSSTFDGRDL